MSQVPAHQEPDVDVVIIGAGFAGLYMLYRARDVLGLRAKAYEASDGVGGTWHLNRYPGARCDSESYVYCYSFSQELLDEWQWSGKYPAQPEILSYLNHVADRFDLRRDISLTNRVLNARFVDDDGLWHLDTQLDGEVTSRYLVTGIGLLASAQYVPAIEGLDGFTGTWAHTGDWPTEGIDFAGKRVAVIGTGSTGVQSIPVIAEQAAALTVFQRTPQFTVPAQHHSMSADEMASIRANYAEVWDKAQHSAGGFPWSHNGRSALEDTPEEVEATFESLWQQGGFRFIFASYRDLMIDRRANELASQFVRRKIREQVIDPRVRELLTPADHPFGAKRPIVDTDYFATYNRPNVSLVDLSDTPIKRITATGIQTTEEQHDLDVIIFATGFDAVTGPFMRMNIEGREGLALRDKWAAGPTSYLGLTVSGFPNMFMITGPGSVFGNIPVVVEHHVEWIAGLIAHMNKIGRSFAEADPDAESAWASAMADVASRTVVPLGDSWGTGKNIPGKPETVLFFLGSYGVYRARCDQVAATDYTGIMLT